MVKLGYKLMSEEHGPADLVRNARRAEEAGFDFAAISDHYFPWLEEQGHAPFAWSVLGAIAQATRRMGLMTAVTCPIMRYHPAIIAQATATMGVLSDDRFTLGLGAGERLNEHVVGEGWPGVTERHERLEEAVDIIQGLLAGQMTTFRGEYFRLDHARLFDRPKRKPDVIMAAGGPDAAKLAAQKTDGLIVTEARKDLVQAYVSIGGKGPRYAEVALCCAPTEEQGRKTAHRYFRWSLSGWPVLAELPARRGVCRRLRACFHRSRRQGGELRSVRRASPGSDREVCRYRLRPHHPEPDRPGPGFLLRAGRAEATARAERKKEGRLTPMGDQRPEPR